jgi:hypothetical protein
VGVRLCGGKALINRLRPEELVRCAAFFGEGGGGRGRGNSEPDNNLDLFGLVVLIELLDLWGWGRLGYGWYPLLLDTHMLYISLLSCGMLDQHWHFFHLSKVPWYLP